MFQLTEIIRRRTGNENFERLDDRAPHRRFSHAVLVDYMADQIPEETAACPEDRLLQGWQKDPSSYPELNEQGGPAYEKMFPYASSYQFVPASWAPDKMVGRRLTVYQASNHDLYYFPNVPLGERQIREVDFPSNKVQMFDFYDRHSGPQAQFYAYPDAKTNILFFDGSVRMMTTGESNKSFWPNAPQNEERTTTFNYEPNPVFEPPARSGDTDVDLESYFRWTREGLHGVDYGGSEINNSN
jgi:prepilin-type processing-associated H-X9-DG protein